MATLRLFTLIFRLPTSASAEKIKGDLLRTSCTCMDMFPEETDKLGLFFCAGLNQEWGSEVEESARILWIN